MRVIPTLAIVIASFIPLQTFAQNGGAATDDDVMNAIHGAKSGHGSTLAVPAPAPESEPAPAAEGPTESQPQGAISDLREQQKEADDEENRKRAKGMFTPPEGEEAEGKTDEEACTARDMASAMKEPANYAYGTADIGPAHTGNAAGLYSKDTQEQIKKMNGIRECNKAFDKLGYDCDLSTGSDCAACEAALKNYSSACSFVKEDIPMEHLPPGYIPDVTSQPITKIPYSPATRPTNSTNH